LNILCNKTTKLKIHVDSFFDTVLQASFSCAPPPSFITHHKSTLSLVQWYPGTSDTHKTVNNSEINQSIFLTCVCARYGLVHHLLLSALDQKKWNPRLNILHLNGTRFTNKPRKSLQSAKEYGCYFYYMYYIHLYFLIF
jgi:hypothetical protein